MAYFDQNFLTIIRQSIEKEAQARHVDVQFEDARGDTGRQADQVQNFIASGVDAIIVDGGLRQHPAADEDGAAGQNAAGV